MFPGVYEPTRPWQDERGETRQAGQKFEGDPAEITAQVVGLLAGEAKVF